MKIRKLHHTILIAAAIISAFVSGCRPESRAQNSAPANTAPPVEEPAPKNADEVLARLQQGNERFVDGRVRFDHASADWRKGLVSDQHPIATILSCSDSRVPPELLFDQGFGDLFVNRVAGNIVDADNLGSIE